MKILYIGYWGANEGLSQATVIPHLEILCAFEQVEKVIYVSIERADTPLGVGGSAGYTLPIHPKLTHVPLRANRTPFRLLNKVWETLGFGHKLIQLAKEQDIDLVICRSSLAGNWGLQIHRRLKIPFVVESFEPHAEYMRELGIWKSWGPSYRYQHRMEEAQKREALHLYPVAENYRRKLIEEGVSPDKITTVPCAVDAEKFRFDPEARKRIREHLGLTDATTTAIYVGKFGGIYYSMEQAFRLFGQAHGHFQDFHLILLTPESESAVRQAAHQAGFPDESLTVALVPHAEVPGYLSAADFAFSLHFPSPAMRYVSPIKNGEYWANGLPIVISEGIGDDAELVKTKELGVLLGEGNSTFLKISEILSKEDGRKNGFLTYFSASERGFYKVGEVYESLLKSLI